MSKLLILSQDTTHPDYRLINAAGMVTWQMGVHADVEILPYYGTLDVLGNFINIYRVQPNPGEVLYDNGVLLYGGCDHMEGGSHGSFDRNDFSKGSDPRADRFINILEYCVNNYEFDYVYRTGTGYYIDVERLKGYVDSLDCNSSIYTGSVFCSNKNPNWADIFVAGSNCIMSRDVVEELVSKKSLYLHIADTCPEDVATGAVLWAETKYVNPCDQLPSTGLQMFCHNMVDGEIRMSESPYVFNYKFFPGQVDSYMKLHGEVLTRNY